MAIDIVARALAVSGKQNLENYYTKTESDSRYVKSSENFIRAFTIPNGVSTGTLAADVKQKLCNPDGHNYYVYDDTSEMILKYSFNEEDEIIQYKAIYLVNDKAYDITMQILPSNGSWRRSQTVLNGATANPTLTGTEAELTGLKVGGTDYKIPVTNITGTDGVEVTKGSDGNVQISGKNFPYAPYLEAVGGRQVVIYNEANKTYGYRNLDDSSLALGSIPFYRDPTQATEAYQNNSLYTGDPKSDYAAANRKYVDDNITAIKSFSVTVYAAGD